MSNSQVVLDLLRGKAVPCACGGRFAIDARNLGDIYIASCRGGLCFRVEEAAPPMHHRAYSPAIDGRTVCPHDDCMAELMRAGALVWCPWCGSHNERG